MGSFCGCESQVFAYPEIPKLPEFGKTRGLTMLETFLSKPKGNPLFQKKMMSGPLP